MPRQAPSVAASPADSTSSNQKPTDATGDAQPDIQMASSAPAGQESEEPELDEASAMRAAVEEQRHENLEIAWECLETAVRLFSGMPVQAEVTLRIAEARSLLGDIQMENEVATGAVQDFTAALEIYEKQLPVHDSRVAEVHSSLAAAWLLQSSMPDLPSEERHEALKKTLSHQHSSAQGMMEHIHHMLEHGTAQHAAQAGLVGGWTPLLQAYEQASEKVKGEPGSAKQTVGATAGAAAPKQEPLADQLPGVGEAWKSWLGSSGLESSPLHTLVAQSAGIVDSTLQRAADIISDDAPSEEASGQAGDAISQLMNMLGASAGSGAPASATTTIGFGSAAAADQAAAPSGTAGQGASTDTSGLAALLGGGSGTTNTLQPRKKEQASVGGKKRVALIPAEGSAAGSKKPAP